MGMKDGGYRVFTAAAIANSDKDKGGIWGKTGGGCLRMIIMIAVLIGLTFTLLYFLD